MIWFGLGVALSAATQLRLPGTPVGPGEALLAGWAGASLGRVLWRGRVDLSRTARPIVLFWVVAFLVLLSGAVVGLLGGQRVSDLVRDLLAFSLVASVFIAFVVQPELDERVRRTLPLIVCASTLPLLLVALTGGRLGIVNLSIYNFGVRFNGWAVNPNQLALALAPIPFACAHLYRVSTRRSGRILFFLVGSTSVVLGLMTLSDALVVAWAGAGATYLTIAWLRMAVRPTRYWRRVVAAVLVPVAVVGMALLAGPTIGRQVGGAMADMYSLGNQGSVRIALWKNGAIAMLRSPLVGNGPGPHSGLSRPFQGAEAHNTVIDWAASTGLIGLAAYLGLMGWAAYRAGRAGSMPMLMMVITLFVFSSLHYTLRHPLFWYYLTASVVLTAPGSLLGEQRAGSTA